MPSPRQSGVLLHPTSLPGGRLGEQAYRFVDWLHAAGQAWWQILPLGPPDETGSPYKAASAFAGWKGLLAEPEAPASVRLIGDLPIYVAPGGADHLSHPELFQSGLVAGVPPDDWSTTGQLWGNPLYDWVRRLHRHPR